MELNNHQLLWPPPLVQKFSMKPCTVDSVLLAALEQFEYTKLPMGSYLLRWRKLRSTTQKEDVKKTPAKMLPSTCSKHCMCTICIVVNVKVGNKN